MAYLFASLLILILTPFIVSLVGRYKRMSRWAAGLLLIAIVYNIFSHIILDNVQIYGWLAVFAALMGALVFGVGDEIFLGQAQQHRSRFFLVTVQIFLALHAMIDGAALVGSELNRGGELWGGHQHGQELSISIVMHRLLFEVFIWKYFLERYGRTMSAVVLVNVGVATVIGFSASKALFQMIPSYFGLFEAFIGGALLHLVYDYFKERIREHSKAVAPTSVTQLMTPGAPASKGQQVIEVPAAQAPRP